LTSRERRARLRGSLVRSMDGGACPKPAGVSFPSPSPHPPRGGRRERKGEAPTSSSPPGGSLSPLGLGPRSHASPQGLTLAGEVNSWVRVSRRVADSPARRGHFGGSPGPLPRALRLSSASNAPGFPSHRSGRLPFRPRGCPSPPAQGSVGRGAAGRGPRHPRDYMHSKLRVRESPHLAPPSVTRRWGPSRKRFTLHEARSRLS
jgi:hypothetical protein